MINFINLLHQVTFANSEKLAFGCDIPMSTFPSPSGEHTADVSNRGRFKVKGIGVEAKS